LDPPVQNQSFNNRQAFIDAFEKYRPVSMCMDLEFTGSTMNDAGVYFGARTPSGWEPEAQNVDSFLNTADTVVIPIRGTPGIRVIWAAEDNSDFEFIDSTVGSTPRRVADPDHPDDPNYWIDAYPTTYHTKHLTDPQGPERIGGHWWDKAGHAYAQIFAGVSGVEAGATVLVQITLNVETISKVGNTFVSSEPSPADPVGLARASSIVENLPSVSLSSAIGAAGVAVSGATAAYQVWGQGSSRSWERPNIGVPQSLYPGGTILV